MLERKRALLVCLALIAGALAVYAYTWHCEFIDFDDHSHITRNALVQDGLTWEGAKGAFTQFHAGQYIPLTWISHMLDVSLFGMDPGAHHIVGVAFHALNACLLFFALRALTGNFWQSAAVAAIFTVHPLNVESVAWAAERKNLLSTMFWMLALLAYARHARQPSARQLGLVALCMAAGLLCKGMLVTLPCLLLLLDFWPLERWRRESWRKLIVEKLPLFALSIGASIITSRAAIAAGGLVPFDVTPLGYRLANAAANYGIYAGKIILPLDLAILYPLPATAPYTAGAISAVLIGIVLFLAWRLRARAPHVLVGLLWFLGTLVPVSGLVQVGKNVLADRFTYVPQIGLLIAIVWSAAAAIRARRSLLRPIVAVGAAAVFCLALRSLQYVPHWKDSASIFTEAAAATEANYVAHANAAFALAQTGDLAPAITHYRQALAIAPSDSDVRVNLGAALSRSGNDSAAWNEFVGALTKEPRHFGARLNLATLYLKRKQPEEAIKHLNLLIHDPEDPYLVHYWLGRAWTDARNPSKAMEHYRAALHAKPGNQRVLDAMSELQDASE